MVQGSIVKQGNQTASSGAGIKFMGMQSDIKNLEERVAWLEKPLYKRFFIKAFRLFKSNGGK